MSSHGQPIPKGQISLVRAFDLLRERNWGPDPWWNQPQPEGDAAPIWRRECEEAFDRDAQELLGAFVSGKLVAHVRDSKSGQEFRITEDEWASAKWPDRLFLSMVIQDLYDGSLAKHNGRTPYVEETQFRAWLNDTEPNQQFIAKPYWGILPTLTWIATRDIALTRHAASPGETLRGLDIGLVVRRAWAKQSDGGEPHWDFESLSDAWDHALAPKLSSGKISALATRVEIPWNNGLIIKQPGKIFPPSSAPGAALFHQIQDRHGVPALIPKGSAGAHTVIEFHDPMFETKAVLENWPSSLNERSGHSAKTNLVGATADLIDELWPAGIPKGLKAKDRNELIRRSAAGKMSEPSAKTIERAMKICASRQITPSRK